jgi:ribosomal protein L18E
MYDSLMKSGKFTALQNKTESGDDIDSVGELVAMCEKQGFIPRYATDIPQDKVDRTLADLKQYTKTLIVEELNLGNLIENAIRQMQKQEEFEQKLEDDTDDAEYRELTKTDAHRADLLMSDSMAKNMIKIIKDASADTAGKYALVSIGEINGKFYPNERVDIESLKARKIIDSDVGLVRITDDGEIDRPLKIYANDFSLTAVKMIVLTGGEVFRYQSRRF